MKLSHALQGRKGFFFTLDALLAIGVLVVGFLLIMSSYTFSPPQTQTTLFAEDFLNVFANTLVSDASNDEVFKMWCSECSGARHIIPHKENTLLEQLGEFYYLNVSGRCNSCPDYAQELASLVGRGLISEQYSYMFKIEDLVLINDVKSDPENTRLLIATKTLVYGIYNKTELFGPYVAEVQVWQ